MHCALSGGQCVMAPVEVRGQHCGADSFLIPFHELQGYQVTKPS